MSAARSRSGIRHDDGPIPADWACEQRRARERLSCHIAWLAIGFLVLAFAPHIPNLPELFR